MHAGKGDKKIQVQLGPRPFYLVDKMSEGDLKDTLEKCAEKTKTYKKNDFSIGHRGAGMQFPEHTQESIISWTTERSGRIVEEVLDGGGSNFYYRTTLNGLENDGDILTTIDVLAQDVEIIGLFSDWPATTTFYANCVKTKKHKSKN